jgi:hypothetical protein
MTMALALISVRDVLDSARREKCFSPMPKTHAEDEKAGDPSSPRGLTAHPRRVAFDTDKGSRK